MTPALTILIADRHEEAPNILKEQLAATNHALLHAKNGEEAMAYLDLLKSKIDLAIIDLPGFQRSDLAAHATQSKARQDYRYQVDLLQRGIGRASC